MTKIQKINYVYVYIFKITNVRKAFVNSSNKTDKKEETVKNWRLYNEKKKEIKDYLLTQKQNYAEILKVWQQTLDQLSGCQIYYILKYNIGTNSKFENLQSGF